MKSNFANTIRIHDGLNHDRGKAGLWLKEKDGLHTGMAMRKDLPDVLWTN